MKKEKSGKGNWWDEEWWLEFLEGETDPSLKADLEVLLKSSSADRALLERWKRAKAWVGSTDDIVLPEDGRVYDRMHAKIMAGFDRVRAREEEAVESSDTPVITAEWRPTVVAALAVKKTLTEEVT